LVETFCIQASKCALAWSAIDLPDFPDLLMQSHTIVIVLAAAVPHAVWNLASKYKRGITLLFVWAYSCA